MLATMANEDDGGEAGLTRRRVLRAGAVGGAVAGAAWVTPTVLTLDAVSAASACCTGNAGINWASTGANRPASLNGPANINGYPWSVGTFGGVPVTFELTGSGTSPYSLVFPGGSDLTGRQPTTQNGGITGIYGLDRQGAQPGTTVTLSIRFSCNVRNLRFTIVDIDRAITGGNNYVDQVVVRPSLNGVGVSGTYTPADTSPSFTPTTASSGTVSSTYVGNATTAGNDNAGNLNVVVSGSVDRVDIVYTAAQAAGAGTLQEVALGNLLWDC